ncbi:MAG: ATP-binding cassette domain-containing protein [Acidobacteria bacterium]|nr:ATP-binding cassette domain-containing protein [Acidobacteriota bacterium]
MRIEINDLTKRYSRGAVPALDGLNLSIDRGTFGLLGPNGAGKTTLIRILSTQLSPTAGTVTIDGLDLSRQRAEVRSRLGYLPQAFGAYPSLTAFEFLDYVGRLAGMHKRRARHERIEEALEDVGLTKVRDRRSGTFSGGMLRRLGIAQAVLANPDFLIVDEPTVGLDPEERLRFRALLSRLSRDRAILISTHIVGDVSSTCEEIGVLDRGKLRYLGAPEGLVSVADGKAWEVTVDDAGFIEMSERFHVVGVVPDGDALALRMVGDAEPPAGASPVAPNLEDAYVYFIESEIDGTAA